MVAVTTTMFGKNARNCIGPEQSAASGSRLGQEGLDLTQLRTRKPVGPGRREPHFLAVDDVMRQEIFDRLLQDELPSHAFDLLLGGNARREFHQGMIEKG